MRLIHRRALLAALLIASAACAGNLGGCGGSSSNDGGDGDLDADVPDRASLDGAGGNSDGATDAARDAGDAAPQNAPFQWVGIVGTGQSLSIGATASSMSTTQPFHNLKLSDTGPNPKYPIVDSGTAVWSAVPLVEPIRVHVAGTDAGYGDGQYPNDIAGETPHSGMASTLTALWKARGDVGGEYVTAHSVVGWSGHCLVDIDKEGGKRAYPASLEEAHIWKGLAAAAGKTFGYGGIILTHGECNGADPTYGAGLYTLWQDYNTDLKAITGQTRNVVLFISQQSTIPDGELSSAVQVWKAGVDHPGQIVCTGPKYQYGYNPGLLHLPAPGYEALGEKYAEVFDLVVNQGVAWKPLQPNKVTRAGKVVTIAFDVPNPPLVWDAHIPLPHQTANLEWKNGKGFEVRDGTTPLTIVSAAIVGATVQLTLAADPGPAAKVKVDYALTEDVTDGGTHGGTGSGLIGALRDSDELVGWDAETLPAMVTKGSAVVTTSTAGAFVHRATKDIVTSKTTGLAAETVVLSHDSDSQLTLSAPWTGATGTVMLSLRHDERNYAVHFTMSE